MQKNDEKTIVDDFVKALGSNSLESLKQNPQQQHKIALLLVRFYITTPTGYTPQTPQKKTITGIAIVDPLDIKDEKNTNLKPGIIDLLREQNLSEENFKKVEEIFKNVDLNAISNIHTNKNSYDKFREAIQPGYLKQQMQKNVLPQASKPKSTNVAFQKATVPSKERPAQIRIGNRPVPVPKRPYAYVAKKPNSVQEQNAKKQPHQNQYLSARKSALFQPANDELKEKLNRRRALITTTPPRKKI